MGKFRLSRNNRSTCAHALGRRISDFAPLRRVAVNLHQHRIINFTAKRILNRIQIWLVEARTVSHQAEAWTPTCGQAVRAPVSPQSKKAWRAAVGISAKLFADADDRPHTLVSPLQAGAVSYGEQFAAALKNARLAFSLTEGRPGFFLEQHREHQQRVNGRPCQCRRVVGRAPQRRV